MQHWKWISDTTWKGCYLLPPTWQIKKIMSIFQHTRKTLYPTWRGICAFRYFASDLVDETAFTYMIYSTMQFTLNFLLTLTARDKITNLMDKPIIANSGHASYVVDIERRCQSRVQRDYLLLSQRLILSAVSKIDFQSRWFDLLLLQSPLECRFNSLDRYSDE